MVESFFKAADVLEVTDVRKVAPGLDHGSTAFVARKSEVLKNNEWFSYNASHGRLVCVYF